MNKYLATIRVKGQSIKTAVFADSAIHARLILQYQFGMDCIMATPTISTNESSDYYPFEAVITKIKRIKPIKPLSTLTPQQSRIEALKRQKEKASKDLESERARQKMMKDQKRIFNLSRPP